MKTKALWILAVMTSLFFYACEKTETPEVKETLTIKTVNDIPADTIVGLINGQPVGVGKFNFYSIENGALVTSSDSNSTKWDLGLRGTTIITNGGNSGPGAGGAFVFVGTFDELTKVPADSSFRVDAAPASYAIPLGSNRGWYVYNPLTTLVTPIPGRILVIRTATGKYAKVEVISYYKGGVTPASTASDEEKLKKQRFYSLRIAYQSNGTTAFQ
ncbi:MAG: hypothetical protein RL131_1315 [Bacteroidota bacterium]